MIARLGLAGAAAWVGYAWLPHLATPLCVHRGPASAGQKIALTFDDGPDPDWTPRVLDALAARDVHATFFLVEMRERLVDDRWIALKPRWEPFRNHPVSFAVAWRKG